MTPIQLYDRRPRSCRMAAWLSILAACALPLSAIAQEEKPAEVASPAADAAQREPIGSPDEFDRQTPRRAVLGYLAAARESDWERAANYLDLRSIPTAKREEAGPDLARELKTVLDRNFWIEIEALSDELAGQGEDGLRSNLDRVGKIESERGAVDVLLARVPRADGVRIWKFSASTVAAVPKLYEEYGYGVLGEYLPEFFFASYGLDIQLWQWIGMLILVLVAYVVSWLVIRLLVGVVRPAVARTRSDIDNRIVEAVIGPVRLLVAVLTLSVSRFTLGLSLSAQNLFGNTLAAVSVIAVTWLILRLVDVFGAIVESRLKQSGQRGATSFVPLGRKTVKTAVVALAALAALDSFGFDVTALIAGLGVGGLAVALAAQKTVENLFGGATLIADRPVQVGDFCRFGEKLGVVEEIGMRSTRVRTLDRTLVTVPNAEFSALQLENFAARDKIWFHPRLGLRYETTPDQMRYVLVEIRRMLYAHPKVDPEPARVRFAGFGAYSLDIDIFAYVRATDYSEFLAISEDLSLRIMDIVDESGTGFAFPSSTTYLAKDDGVDSKKTQAAEKAVRGWRTERELFLPGFPSEKVSELRDTLEYPEPGAPEGVRS